MGLGLVAVVALVWVPAALAGPTIDCGILSQAECDEAVVAAMKEATTILPLSVLLPVTSVRLLFHHDCLVGWHITWIWVFSDAHSGLC